jgi:hypothetical protein
MSVPKLKSFSVATVNTHMCEALRSKESVEKLVGNDILLMQEVVGMSENQVAAALGAIGMQDLVFHEGSGLAIAVSSRFSIVESDYNEIQPASWAKNIRLLGDIRTRFRARGMIVATLVDVQTNTMIFAGTSHPIVCTRPLSRTRQVKVISAKLQDSFGDGPLVFGQDGNHYPGPNAVDRQLAEDNGLSYVSYEGPTCLLENTKCSFLWYFGLPDGRLDSMLIRGLHEQSSSVFDVDSDHLGLLCEVSFLAE